ncbi:hypothetical protein RND71_025068 [Anisodus tanguticus]|uniref:Uncharacterized protein n=1 Tax=Anisodus tanguticus TaxID=243964 RepID=A0AAE1RRK4_9SOLA|nr:hypothetical protein RND71_025068 [Anisodus tanguticus]
MSSNLDLHYFQAQRDKEEREILCFENKILYSENVEMRFKLRNHFCATCMLQNENAKLREKVETDLQDLPNELDLQDKEIVLDLEVSGVENFTGSCIVGDDLEKYQHIWKISSLVIKSCARHVLVPRSMDFNNEKL